MNFIDFIKQNLNGVNFIIGLLTAIEQENPKNKQEIKNLLIQSFATMEILFEFNLKKNNLDYKIIFSAAFYNIYMYLKNPNTLSLFRDKVALIINEKNEEIVFNLTVYHYKINDILFKKYANIDLEKDSELYLILETSRTLYLGELYNNNILIPFSMQVGVLDHAGFYNSNKQYLTILKELGVIHEL